MANEPYYTPGQSDGVPLRTLTEFTPKKPAGAGPVSPMPLPEGSEIDKHSQLFAFDSVSGQFKPLTWINGRLGIDAALDVSSLNIGSIQIKDPTGSQESNVVTVGQLLDGLNALVVVNRESGSSAYTPVEVILAVGIDQPIDLGTPMKDIYLSVDQPVTLKFNSVAKPPIALAAGQFDFGSIWANKMFVTTTVSTKLQVFANG